jgi:hypothetical protein
MSFYVDLPSNVALDMYPSNTPAHYVTPLHKALYLPGQWEVALVEVQIPQSWDNIMDANNSFTQMRQLKTGDKFDTPGKVLQQPDGRHTMHLREAKIQNGLYLTMETLVEAMNNALDPRMQKILQFHFNTHKQRIYIFCKEADGHIVFTKNDTMLANMLGISDIDKPLPAEGLSTYIGKYKADLSMGNSSVYIYSNIIHAQHVGNTLAPLLRIIPVDNISNGHIHQVFNTPYYIPVSRSNIDTIEIDLRTDMGDRIVFEAGKVMCKLHFRQVSH